MSLSTIKIGANVTWTQTTATFGGVSRPITVQVPENLTPLTWSDGTGANAVDLAWADQRGYDSTGVTLDLSALASDASTNTGAATFTAVKVLLIRNHDSTNNLIVGNAASAQFTGPLSAATTTYTIPPGGYLLLVNPSAAGWDCATAKNLKIASSSGTVTATVAILGLD